MTEHAHAEPRPHVPAHAHCHGHTAARHADREAPPPRATPEAAEWTCPMHPEVVRPGPGACPKCGMALEPRVVSATDDTNPELADMSRRLVVSSVLTLPILAAMVSEFLPGQPLQHAVPAPWMAWGQALLATPVVLWAGWPFFQRGWASLVNRHLNMFTLIALGVGAAYGFSLAATLAPGLFPTSLGGHGDQVGLYFEPAAVIVVLVLLGQVLELRARSRTSAAIKGLLRLAPSTARRAHAGGDDEDVPLAHVHVGDRLRVRPGERVPVDGVVVDGETSIDESMMTGESLPVGKTAGSAVTGGTMNTSGSIVIEARRVGRDTLLARIVQLVGDAHRSRAPIQRLADDVSAWFVPAVIVVAIATFAVWAWLGTEPRLSHGLVNAVAVLIIACPCALGLATPMSITVGAGRGAELGVLIRDAEALEVLARVDTLVVDKTGTLTEGRPALATVHILEDVADSELLRLAASVERASEHPLAGAIVAGAHLRGLTLADVHAFRATSGKGVSGTVDGRVVDVGAAGFLGERGVRVEAAAAAVDALRRRGETAVFVAVDGRLVGLLGVADPVKPTSAEAIRALEADGVSVVMLTGDHRTTAEAVGRTLGLQTIHAGVLPDGKAAVVAALQGEGRRVAMAGDGVNDAPALARADVGIAMGTGADVAIESAGVTLVKGDLRGVVRARRLSRATMRNIRQNLFFAFVYNLLGVPIAAGLLYPVTGLLLSPMLASAAMTLSSVSVIGNALRLRREAW